ncbi:MAG TPA: hypothetical protein VGP31_03090 [Planosporangium sp.]|nr:hypothetical protein [Planosporangium sp.]
MAEAEEFLRLLHDEHPNLGPVRHRLNRLFMVALPRLNRPRCPFSDQPASRPGTPPARTPDRYADTSIQ